MVSESLAKNGSAVLLQYQPEYLLKTDMRGSFLELINKDSVEQQIFRFLKKTYYSGSYEKLTEELTKFPNWQEALFLRENTILFLMFLAIICNQI
ncbi:MAG: hypothetical protein IPG79_03400 [Saprospiraceae bacterium]|nr:hypothetical protein [Saprospiraceae bacterium]